MNPLIGGGGHKIVEVLRVQVKNQIRRPGSSPGRLIAFVQTTIAYNRPPMLLIRGTACGTRPDRLLT